MSSGQPVLEWATIVSLTIAPLIAFILGNSYKNKKFSNDIGVVIFQASFLFLGVCFVIMLARYDTIQTRLDYLFIKGHTETSEVWVDADDTGHGAHYEDREFFIMDNPKEEWVTDIVAIYYFILLIGSPLLCLKLMGNMGEDKKKLYSRI